MLSGLTQKVTIIRNLNGAEKSEMASLPFLAIDAGGPAGPLFLHGLSS